MIEVDHYLFSSTRRDIDGPKTETASGGLTHHCTTSLTCRRAFLATLRLPNVSKIAQDAVTGLFVTHLENPPTDWPSLID